MQTKNIPDAIRSDNKCPIKTVIIHFLTDFHKNVFADLYNLTLQIKRYQFQGNMLNVGSNGCGPFCPEVK